MAAFGAVDLYSGSSSLTGSNLFTTDKNPLNELTEGVEDVVGKQATSAGSQVLGGFTGIINAILGIPLEILTGSDDAGTLGDLDSFFGNVEQFLGDIDFLSPSFDPEAAIEDFINIMLSPSGLLAMLDGGGLLNIANIPELPMDLIEGLLSVFGGLDLSGSDPIIAAIESAIGEIPVVGPILDDLIDTIVGSLGGSGSGHSVSDVGSALENIPGLNIVSTLLADVIPGLDASHIISGGFPISMITDLTSELGSLLSVSTWQHFLDGILGTSTGTGTSDSLISFITDLLPISTFQTMLDDVLGGSGNPLSAFTGFLTGTNTTANNANSNATGALTQLANLATGLLGSGNDIGDVIDFLLGINTTATGAAGGVSGLEGDLQSIFDGVLGGSGNTPLDFTGFLTTLLSPSSPLNALNIFGLVQPGNLSQVGIGQIGNTVVNLLTNPNFQGTGALDGGGIWSQDPTVGFGGTMGSAKVTATGATKELLSNSVAVTQGQTIALSGHSQWTSVTQNPSTTPIEIAVNAYLAGAGVSSTVIQAVAASPATSTWQLLSGNYTVPSGVDSIRMKLVVSADATAGSVWFTNLSLSKTGLLPTSLVGGLDSLTGGFTSDLASIFTSLTTFPTLTQFTSLLGVFGGSTSAASSLISSFLTGSSTLNASNIGTGTILDTFVPGIGTTVDNIVQNLLGLSGSGFSHSQANTALANTAAALTSAQAAIATLNTTLTSGVSASDTFTTNGTTSSNLGSNWLSIYSPSGHGHWGTPSGNSASFQPNALDATTIESLNVWQGANSQSITDLQVVTIILSNTAGKLLGSTGHNDIWLRISSGTTSYSNVTGIRCRYSADGGLRITRFVNGVSADLNSAPSGTVTAPGSGTNLTAYAGTAGTVRFFDMHINGTSVLSIPEVGSGSLIGTGNRGWGWGGRSEGLIIIPPLQEPPATIHQWNAADQPAA